MASRAKRQPYNPAQPHDRRAKEINRGQSGHTVEVLIDDPYEAGAKIATVRSLRNDPLARLHDRKQIDEAQYHGGRAFQHDFETAERGPRAIDPSKEFVDGGLMPEPITESQRKATKRLATVNRGLGENGSALIRAVLIERITIEKICDDRGLMAERERLYVGRRFRECLDDLARFYDFA